MQLRFDAARTVFALAVVAGATGCESYQALPADEVTLVVYDRPAEPETPTAEAPVSSTAGGPRSSGFPACDAYFRRAESCIATLSPSSPARSRFAQSIDIARREDRIIARSTNPATRREAAARCEAALAAYDDAPCPLADPERNP
jgi:hypothetical protein